jgi:hypothetical protein
MNIGANVTAESPFNKYDGWGLGVVLNHEGNRSLVEFEHVGAQLVFTSHLVEVPTEDEIQGLCGGIQSGWSRQKERAHRGVLAKEDEGLVFKTAHAVGRLDGQRVYELK